MEKLIAIPTISNPSMPTKFGIRWIHNVINAYWSLCCRRYTYNQVLEKTVLTIDDILSAHSLKDRFYKNINFEIVINSISGWRLDLSKAFTSAEENIIVILYKEAHYGQITYSITFENKAGRITGIQNMFQGFCIDSYFHDQESDTLNPNVLASLLTAKKHLFAGAIGELKISNKPISFGRDFWNENESLK